jgi:type IV pilus biogenesis protein PilP
VDEPEPLDGIATLPTTRTVAKKSTYANAIDLGEVNLIGVYGSSSNRRALVRMPNGRFVKVQVGDRLDGGKVAAIGDSELRYVKKGRTITLKIMKSG